MKALAVPPFIPSTRPQETLAAYRGLLRAITYQPDPVVRAFLHETARKRFRSKAGTCDAKLGSRIKKVHGETRRIERANRGVLEDVVKLLNRAYGREGSRRRVLIKNLLHPEEDDLPQDDDALSEFIKGNQVTSLAWKINTTKRFDAFLKSQLALPSDIQRGSNSFKDLKPKIPESNLWARPMPLKRQTNIRKQWWADALEKMHPPVPHHEWDRLRDLATGTIPMWNFMPPRKAPEEPEKLAVVDNELVVNNLRNPAREKGTLEWRADNKQIFVAPKIKEATISDKTLKTAYNFQRTMRRIYGRIWAITPKMYKNLDTKGWVVEWGDSPSPLYETPVATLSTSQLELFEGIDVNASIPRTKNKHKAEPVRKAERAAAERLKYGKAEEAPKSAEQKFESVASHTAPAVTNQEAAAMLIEEKTTLPVDVPETPKEKHFIHWDPESSFWKPEPPSVEDPLEEQHSVRMLKKMIAEKTGVSKEAIAQLARRQKELLDSNGVKGTMKGGRGIMRTLPTRKELAANSKT